jgi:hypothetical protein
LQFTVWFTVWSSQLLVYEFAVHGYWSRKDREMQDHRKLKVWQRAQEKCVEVYLFTADFPVEERYGMTAQLRKAAVSVGGNAGVAVREGSSLRDE